MHYKVVDGSKYTPQTIQKPLIRCCRQKGLYYFTALRGQAPVRGSGKDRLSGAVKSYHSEMVVQWEYERVAHVDVQRLL